MSRPSDAHAPKGRKPWTRPVVRKIELTEEERATLLASDDPTDLLRKMKPNLR